MEIESWLESVKEILLFGADDGDEHNNGSDLDSLNALKVTLQDFLNQTKNFNTHNDLLENRLAGLLTSIEKEDHVLSSEIVLQKTEKYIKLKTKIQHMSLVRAMYQLRRYSSVKDIPSLIFNVRDDVPGVLLGHSRIKKIVIETVCEVKGGLLKHFQQLLDDHIVATQKESSTQTSSNDSPSGGSDLWMDFLSQARDWLLAYSMVALLPTVLTETRGMVLEKFQDILDEALTPTWGRYHYHLQVARRARSSQQIMWTFEYTRSFARMVCDLSAALTSSAELQRLCPLDYASAGQKQVLDKACKFMRAHLAQIVVDFAPLSRELCLQLAEETLELDDWMGKIAQFQTAKATNNSGGNKVSSSLDVSTVSKKYAPIKISEVLYDAKAVFHQWLLMEHRFFHFELRGKCKSAKKVFSFEFGDDIRNSSTSSNSFLVGKGVVEAPPSMSRLRCYQGVYDCMCLFFTACERYQHLPSAAQRIFSVCILEPLLCTALGLLLYRTRSSSVLFQISMGTYQPQRTTSSSPAGTPSNTSSSTAANMKSQASTPVSTLVQLPQELVEFTDSACYFQSSLGASAHRSLASRSAAQFKSQLWTELQSWMPQILISEEDARKGFSVVDLVDKAWKLPAEINSEDGYSYRNNVMQLGLTKPSSGLPRHHSGSSSSRGSTGKVGPTTTAAAAGEVCEIGECVDVARGLAITLCNVLRQQLLHTSK